MSTTTQTDTDERLSATTNLLGSSGLTPEPSVISDTESDLGYTRVRERGTAQPRDTRPWYKRPSPLL